MKKKARFFSQNCNNENTDHFFHSTLLLTNFIKIRQYCNDERNMHSAQNTIVNWTWSKLKISCEPLKNDGTLFFRDFMLEKLRTTACCTVSRPNRKYNERRCIFIVQRGFCGHHVSVKQQLVETTLVETIKCKPC